MKKLLSFLALIGIAFNLSAANVRLYFAQPFSAGLDTNAMVATQISTNILSNGGVVPTGLPSKRITPASDGYATNYFNVGWYAIKNTSSGSAVVINVYDSGATLYDLTNLLQSGFNTYAVTVYGSNPAPSLNSITNALGGMPLLTALTNAIPTNTIIPAVSGFTAIIPTNFDVLGTAAAVQTYASGASNANATASAAVQSYATAVSNNVVALTSYATGVSNQVSANQLFATNATTGLSNQVSTAQTTANNAITFGQAVSNNVNGVTSYSTGISNLLAAFKLIANTNQYIAGANMSATTNGAVVTWSSSGSGSATNSIGIINGAGSGTQLTNSTLLGSVTATNLDARYDSAGAATAATNGLGTMAQASTNSYVLTNALLAITNTVVTSATNAAAAIALNATNAAVITSTNLSASMIQNSTNKALATATNSFDALGVATIVSNGVTTAWQAGTNQLQANLNGTNGVMITNIFNSTNNLWVPLNQGPFYDTNNIYVVNTNTLFNTTNLTWSGSAYTNAQGFVLTNNGTLWSYFASIIPSLAFTNSTLIGKYFYNSGAGSIFVNYQFFPLQPATSNGTNWAGVNTNSIGTYWPTMTQLNTASNGLQSQITAGGVNGLTVTNISSNTVYQATNGFGNIVTQNLPGFTNNLVSSSTNAIQGVFNTLITGPTNSAVQSATNFSGLVTAAVIKLATNGTLQVGTNSFLLSISAGTNIIGLNYGADGNFSYKLSAASTWTNSFDSRYTLNQAGGILSANSNGSQLALISWVNIPTNGTATNMAVGSSGASPAPVIAFGRTNQVNGQIIGGNAEISGALVVQSNITISGTYTGNGTGLTNTQAGSLNPAGVTQSYTNAIAASQVTITNPVTVGGITYWLDGTGSHGSNTVNAASGGFDTNRYLVGNPVTQMVTNATAAAQANNLVIPTGGVLTNLGTMIITNGQLVVNYPTKIGSETNTVVDASGRISFGGSLAMNPNTITFKELPWVKNGPNFIENWGQDTPGGQIWANYTSGLGGGYYLLIVEGLISGGTDATNSTYPNGALWYAQDQQGRVLYKDDFAAASGAGEKQAESKIFDIEYSLFTNNSSDYGWTGTNVFRLNLATNGVVQFGPLQSPVPTILSNTLYSDWTGTVLPWWSMNTNAAWLGNGGVLVSNNVSSTTNVIVVSANNGTSFSSYTYDLNAAWTNSGDVTVWISNAPPIVIWRAGAPAVALSTNLTANLYAYSITWTNKNGWKEGTNITFPLSVTNQSTFVFSNAAPFSFSYPGVTALVTNSTGVSVWWTPSFVVVDATAGYPHVFISVAGVSTNVYWFTPYPGGETLSATSTTTNTMFPIPMSPGAIATITDQSSGAGTSITIYTNQFTWSQ